MLYVRNAWYVAAWSRELPAEKPFGLSILGEAIVVFRAKTGKLAALEDRCVHRFAPLSLGRCEGERLRCMYHGMLYESDGRVVEIPGETRVPASARVRSYPVVDRHVIPGILLMSSAAYPEGTAAACGMRAPASELGGEGVTFTSQAVTSLTEKTSRYFFSWGPRKDQGDEALRDVLMGIADQAFTEDRLMIEAQQRVIDRGPQRRVLPTGADRGITLYNRLVEELAAKEAPVGKERGVSDSAA